MRSFVVIVVLMGIIVAACGKEDPEVKPESQDSTSFVEPVDMASLRNNAEELDGKIVEVHASFWSNGTEQYLTDVMMESYPPQISKTSAVVLLGEVPGEVLDQLHRSEPPFGNVTWGSVIVTGEVQFSSGTGQITLEVVSVEVV